VQGRHNAKCRVNASQYIGHGQPGLHRVIDVGAGHAHQACLALDDLVVSRSCALRAVVPESGNGADDQARVDFVQPADREAEPVKHARPEILR